MIFHTFDMKMNESLLGTGTWQISKSVILWMSCNCVGESESK
jgi:hypothetical protein